jgi:hypothetical protein
MNPLDSTQVSSVPRRRHALIRWLPPALMLSLAPLFGAGQLAVVNAASGDRTISGGQVTCT